MNIKYALYNIVFHHNPGIQLGLLNQDMLNASCNIVSLYGSSQIGYKVRKKMLLKLNASKKFSH